MCGKLGGKSLLVEVLKSDGCGLNVGNPTMGSGASFGLIKQS